MVHWYLQDFMRRHRFDQSSDALVNNCEHINFHLLSLLHHVHVLLWNLDQKIETSNFKTFDFKNLFANNCSQNLFKAALHKTRIDLLDLRVHFINCQFSFEKVIDSLHKFAVH